MALRLAERGQRVTVLEGNAGLGGLAAPQALGAVTWDRFYHVILESDRSLLSLLDSLGLRDRIHWGTTRTGFFTDGRYHSLSSSWDFLRFPPLSLLGKARLAATILRASRIRDAEALEAVPVDEWLRQWSGARTFERIWRPLLQAKLGDNWNRVSAAFIWAVIARMYAARRTGLKRERFGYLAGGYDTALRALRARLEGLGVEIVTGDLVREVTGGAGGCVVRTERAEHRARSVVLTVPCSRVAGLVPQLSAEEQARLARVEYQGVVCAAMLLDAPLTDYYVSNITDPGFPFTAVIEMSALVPRAQFGGYALVYLPRYLTRDDPDWGLDDAAWQQRFIEGLARMHPGFTASRVRHCVISRAREVQALPTLHYTRDALPEVRTSVPGVFLVTSAQIVNGTLNANESVALADREAATVAAPLSPA